MHLTRALSLGGRALCFFAGLSLLVGTARADCDVFEETNGIVVMEIEVVAPAGDWVEETSISGYTGDSYFRWDGPNMYGNPGSGKLKYKFKINQPGNYRFRIHNRHNHGDPSEENDVWARLNGGKWIKTYSNGGNGSSKKWVWDTTFEHNHNNHEPANYDLTAGIHTLELSGRSHNFIIDRIHLYKNGHPDGTNKNAAQSPCDGDGPYCQAKQNSEGCVPSIVVFGQPSASSSSPFRITAQDIINKQSGILLYSFNQNDVPFLGGSLCLGAGIRRTNIQGSGGTQGGPDCNGRFDMDFNAFIQSGKDPQLTAGETVYTQYWYRDAGDPFRIGLTEGYRFTIQP